MLSDHFLKMFPGMVVKYDFMSFYGIGELFERGAYEKPKRRTSDYIFCDVEFEAGGKTYCYLADAEDASLPVDKAKHIIKRIDEDEIDEYLSME